ncbi:MAG: hypothetical protein J4N74_04335 [Chloroflexi bacterium]|nr:hypothetical protein [Chloroflexota bacterium]MCI0891334.1 hypothetical protein [Chloroflexota bacterium]
MGRGYPELGETTRWKSYAVALPVVEGVCPEGWHPAIRRAWNGASAGRMARAPSIEL